MNPRHHYLSHEEHIGRIFASRLSCGVDESYLDSYLMKGNLKNIIRPVGVFMNKNEELVKEFGMAFNRHDIDALMGMVTEDCVFYAISGPEIMGKSYCGKSMVKEGFELAWKTCPDASWSDVEVFIAGDKGVMESTFRGTMEDGKRIEARLVDVLAFRDGKISVKNAYRKSRPPL